MGAVLLVVYASTMAPGLTFWDAGEFITAANGLGIPHPPGTPLFVALGRAWTLLLGGVLGVARASNLLSAVSTAVAGGLTAWVIARGLSGVADATWGATAGALCAGLMTSVWANATETEVYAVSLMHVAVLLACALRARDDDSARGDRWVLITAYLIALAPAVHLSALVGAPAAIALAARRRDGTWVLDRVALLGGVLVAAAGVGRMSLPILGAGVALSLGSVALRRGRTTRAAPALASIVLLLIASSALVMLLVRARHDPVLNQGNPATWSGLADVVARRQYDVAPLWPRQAPLWIQLANVAQYLDWQFAMGLGDGIFTSPVRVFVTALYVFLGAGGWRAMRRDSRPLADAVAVLALCGSLGVCAYLNLKAGASLGYGFVPSEAHEARERDYFFVLAFWGWGIFAGYGALSVTRSRRWPAWLALGCALVPLVSNAGVNDRAHGVEATAARALAAALLGGAPPHAVLFVGGDNDTYPLWYLQQVEGVRPDVTTVTFPLLPADWYPAEIARRTGLRWPSSGYVPGARWRHEEQAALIAQAARAAGRPVAASPALPRHDRNLLGSRWRLEGFVYVAGGARDGSDMDPVIGLSAAPQSALALQETRDRRRHTPDDVSSIMLALLECPRLARLPSGPSAARDSLEVRCNFR